jgi:hypothetical protein
VPLASFVSRRPRSQHLTPLSFRKLHQNSLISLLMVHPRVLQGVFSWPGMVWCFSVRLFTPLSLPLQWKLTVVYGPCHGQDRQSFSSWLNNLQISTDENWMIVGYFIFYRSMENRNRGGANLQDIMTFNQIISNLGLQKIPLKGRNYTWSNMQEQPLFEQLDWCFTSANWILDYPNTLMLPLARTTSDHTPCVVQIRTSIPKAQIFRFQNFWVDQPGFTEVVQMVWNLEVRANNSVSRVSAKFKLLRRVLKRWAKRLSQIKNQIQECNLVISIMDRL